MSLAHYISVLSLLSVQSSEKPLSKKLTEEQEAEAIRLCDEGYNIYEIMEAIGCTSYSNVQKLLAGRPKHCKPGERHPKEARIIKLLREGYAPDEIAIKLRVSRKKVAEIAEGGVYE